MLNQANQPSQSFNPYFNLGTIHNTEMFFGRTSQLRRFYANLTNRQSVSILGLRRIGKSSFLWCAALPEVQANFHFDLSHHIFIFLDLHEYLHKTSEDFFHMVSKEITNRCTRTAGLTLQSVASMSGTDRFSSVLDQVVEQGFFPVLLLDSFDKVTLNEHFGPEFFGFLRSQASRGRVSYVTASIAPLSKVAHRGIEGSPFFNIFAPYKLEALTPEEANDLITIPAKRAEMPFTETEIALIRRLAGRHPFFIQRVSYILFEEKIHNNGIEIDEHLIETLAYEELYHHLEDIWEQLSESQQIQLQQEAQQRERQYRELPELSESKLFRQFVRSMFQTDFLNIDTKILEDVLEKLRDPKALEDLGKTSFARLQLVSQHLDKTNRSSMKEKGMAVREVLCEAFEHLKVSGNRNDSASEWLHYNILYYRYFKYHLKNEQITARLDITSVRQFYRERTKALEELLNALMEMERLAIATE